MCYYLLPHISKKLLPNEIDIKFTENHNEILKPHICILQH